MTTETALAQPDVDASPDAEPPLLDGAWSHRSARELREIVEHGLQGGEGFEGAVRELERRARSVARETEDASQADRIHRQTLLRIIVAGLILVAVAGLLFGLFQQ